MVEWCSVMHFLVKFYPLLEFSFLVSHSLTNCPKTKENKIGVKNKIELQHL